MSPDGLKQPPEERLLRLIRGKAPQAASGGAPARLAASVTIPATAWAQKIPQAAAIILAVVVVVEAVWVVVQLVRPLPPVVMQPSSAPVRPPTEARDPEPIPSVAASAIRPLFSAPSAGAAPARQAMSGSAKLLAARLTLTGIMSTEPPQAIIEDTQTQKTYMLTVGQPLAEGAVLDQILDNRVILDFDGEKVELSL